MNQKLIIMGIQGCGKGTHAEKLVADFGLTFIGAGDMFRWLTKNNTTIGRTMKETMARGELIDDQLVLDVMGWRLDLHDWDCGLLLDGFPRNEKQRHWLLEEKKYPFDHVIHIDIPDEQVVIDRMLGRGRADDNEKAIKMRIAEYRRETEPTLEAYEKAGLLREVLGIGTIDEVYQRILNALGWSKP
jgi:adenylate kinase